VAIALKNENGRYRSLLGLKTDPPIPMVAARVVLDSRGPFADTRIANAGREVGVRPGNPVMSEYGLVGRVIGVTANASRVLMLTDVASRTPVMIDRTNARAILTGDGGPNPRLDYLRGQDPVREGDRILTSGDGGILPRGLPVGFAVKGLDGKWRVVLASDKGPIDFVRILLFEDFTQVINRKELDHLPVPPPTPGEPAAVSAEAPAIAPTLAGAAAKPAVAAATAAKAVAPAAAAKPTAATPAGSSAPGAKSAAASAIAKPHASADAAKPAAARTQLSGDSATQPAVKALEPAKPHPKAPVSATSGAAAAAQPPAAKTAKPASAEKTAAVTKPATVKPKAKPKAVAADQEPPT
jgi:rod shape-determining protein MreC